MNLKKSDFFYDLPQRLIAQIPIERRDESRLLAYSLEHKTISHLKFFDIADILKPGDALVINHTRVIPARLHGFKDGTGGRIEFLLLRRIEGDDWEVILKPGRRAKPGSVFHFGDRLSAEIISEGQGGVRIARFSYTGVFEAALAEVGETPLPPYITERLDDARRYQTVYAKEDGSAAAPTAGLHFTNELLEKISDMGVYVIPILLHVGLGTFRPVKDDNILDHHMHSEYYEVSSDSAERINRVKQAGGRIFAVGTTSVRTLETVAAADGTIIPGSGFTDIFIYPGYSFKAVDALITNFHLPESTLLMLISALMGREEALGAYAEAVAEEYRFFSFGDAMVIF